MKHKKGQVAKRLITWIIVLALLGVSMYLIVTKLIPTVEQAGKTTTGLIAADQACKTEGELLRGRGISPVDKDNDLRPDLNCDSCRVGATGGNNDNDADADGVPDDCDAKFDDADIGFCFEEGKDCNGDKCCDKKAPTKQQCGPPPNLGIYTDDHMKKGNYQCKI
jgi:hypothetical protein